MSYPPQRPNQPGQGYTPGFPQHGYPYPGQVPLPPQKSGSNRGVWIAVAVIGGVVLVGGCVVGGLILNFVTQFATDSTEMKTLTSSDGISQIEVPRNWITTMGLNADASTEAANPFTENYVIVITEPKSDLPGYDLADYAQLVSDNMKQNIPGLFTSLPTTVTINGHQGKQFQARGTMDGAKIVCWMTAVSGRGHYHQVMVWTLESRELKNRELLLNVTNSFRERR